MTQSEVLAIRYATTITGLAIYLYNKRKLYGGWPIMQPMHIPQLVDRQLQREGESTWIMHHEKIFWNISKYIKKDTLVTNHHNWSISFSPVHQSLE